MSANNQVQIDCAVCGFFLGSGIPGGSRYCARCKRSVLTEARAGNLGAVLGALAVVGLGLLVAKLLSDIFE